MNGLEKLELHTECISLFFVCYAEIGLRLAPNVMPCTFWISWSHHSFHPSSLPCLPSLFLRWKTEIWPQLALLRANSAWLYEKGSGPMKMTHVAGAALWDPTLIICTCQMGAQCLLTSAHTHSSEGGGEVRGWGEFLFSNTESVTFMCQNGER